MKWLPLILVTACASSETAESRQLPNSAVLCQLWEGTGEPRSDRDIRGYGTLSTDVEGVLGAPSDRGDSWVYDYGTNRLTVTFEAADLCVQKKPVNGKWVASLKLDGAQPPKCWADTQNAKPCDGCIAPFEAKKCQ